MNEVTVYAMEDVRPSGYSMPLYSMRYRPNEMEEVFTAEQ